MAHIHFDIAVIFTTFMLLQTLHNEMVDLFNLDDFYSISTGKGRLQKGEG